MLRAWELALVAAGKAHLYVGLDYVVTESDELCVREGIAAGVGISSSIVNLFKKAFNRGRRIPVCLHTFFVGREVFQGDDTVGYVEVVDEGMCPYESKAVGSVFKTDDEALVCGSKELFFQCRVDSVVCLEGVFGISVLLA
jgi:hypothetical protein